MIARTKSQLARVLLAPLLLMVAPAHSQDDGFELGSITLPKAPPPLFVSSFEAGIGYQSSDAFYMGRYGGVTDRGPFALVKARVAGGDPWDEGSTFWNGAADVTGFDTLSVLVRGGVQGRWRVSAFFDDFTRAYTQTAMSPFNGIGTASLSLPATWVSGATSARFSTLLADLKPFDLQVGWQNVGGDLVLVPYAGYEVRLQFSTRHRDGLRAHSLPFGQEADFSVGVFFPQPVDYKTHQVTASIGYVNPRLQWTAAYNLAVFTNGIDAVKVPNPYSRSLGIPWQGGAFAGYPLAVAQYGLPPDSVAHQVVLSGGYAVAPKTRLTLRLSYALQSQNEAFLPYTPSTQLNVPLALPRPSLDGNIHRTHLAVNLAAREWKIVDLAFGYTLDDRQNHSPSDLYSYVANDAQDQIQPLIPGNSRYIRRNLPHSFTFHQAKAEVGYRARPRTRLSLTYTGDLRRRNDQQVAETVEQTLKAKVLSSFAEGSAWASYSYVNRNGSHYDSALAWDRSHTDAYLNASPNNRSIEQPQLRKYNLADRERHQGKGGVTFSATPALALSASGGFAQDIYANSLIGLRRSKSLAADADVSYVAGKQLTASAFYGFERIRSDQNGYLIFDTRFGNPSRDWSVQNRDTVHSAGVRLSWQAVPETFKLDAGYTLSASAGRIAAQSTPAIIYTVIAPVPDSRDVTHHLDMVGEYAFRPDTSLKLGYTYERHRSRDWQYDDLNYAPVAQILGSGIQPPRYNAHIIWVTTRYQF